MQDCFRLHPEVYGDELEDDESSESAAPGAAEAPVAKATPPEGDAMSKPAETASPRDSNRADEENAELTKEAEKQNVPPAQA